MSVLVILLPPRPRGDPRAASPAGADAEAATPTVYDYVLSADGRSVHSQGRASAAQLPPAAQACLLVADADIAWQRLSVPKAPTARRRAALGAVLEEQLLEDDADLHLALEPGASGGHSAWVAVTQGARLAAAVADLERAGVALTRVAPSSWPGTPTRLHVLAAAADGQAPTLICSDAQGVGSLRLRGTLARQRVQALPLQDLQCSAHPAAAAEAERWLEATTGQPLAVALLGDAERALQALDSPWNLRQFALAPQHRGLRGLAQLLSRLRGPEWRPLRWGVAAAVLVQVLGLNAYAWKLDAQLQAQRRAQVQLLQQAHPQVRAVLDAPLQMQRETERLRQAAGQAGTADLEPLLDAVAGAWPEGLPPLQALRFENGRLSLSPESLEDAARALVVANLQASGYRAQMQGTQLVVSAANPP